MLTERNPVRCRHLEIDFRVEAGRHFGSAAGWEPFPEIFIFRRCCFLQRAALCSQGSLDRAEAFPRDSAEFGERLWASLPLGWQANFAERRRSSASLSVSQSVGTAVRHSRRPLCLPRASEPVFFSSTPFLSCLPRSPLCGMNLPGRTVVFFRYYYLFLIFPTFLLNWGAVVPFISIAP